MGIYDDIYAKRTSLVSTRYVDANGQTLSEEHGEKSVFKEGDEVELVRGDLVNILLKAIPDVPCHFHKEIISLTQKDQFVEVTFKDGHIERYDLVMAADGLHSSTRGMTFSDEDCQFFNLGYYISIFSIPNYLNLNRTQVIFVKYQKIISINSDKDPDRAFTCVAFRAKKVLSGIANERGQKKCLRDYYHHQNPS